MIEKEAITALKEKNKRLKKALRKEKKLKEIALQEALEQRKQKEEAKISIKNVKIR